MIDGEVSLITKNEFARWYKLKDHPVQKALVEDKVRFKIVPAGRRSGKTERAKRFMAKTALEIPGMYFLAAPTYQQAKKIWWEDMKKLTFRSLQLKQPSESELVIYIGNHSTIHVLGLDKPARVEGQPWSGGIIDEIADCKADAWELNVKPALNTFNPLNPDYRAWCWLIGVPDGLNHYYALYDYCMTRGLNGTGEDKEYKAYTWHSADILPPDIIEAAKRTMGAKQYKQEYEASFETSSGRIYDDYCFKNLTDATIATHEQLLWFHDFNFTPLSSGIGVRRKETTGLKRDCLIIADEIILTSAVAYQSALEFVNKYDKHQNKNVIVYGDPSGKVGEKHGQISNYKVIEEVLTQYKWKFERRVRAAAPAIRDRQNAVRAKIQNANGHISLFVNPVKAVYAHKGLSTVQVKEGSAFLEEETDYQHITTAIGYMVEYEWPISGGMKKIQIAGI